ncbi:MAG TPA: hypothetical protein VHZ74_17075 [Bryobacteraceae bacterium]|nr:hypothetical protein [Bryobacteraceae bacterium]
MSHRGYASTSANVRHQLEELIGTDDGSEKWQAFLRRETTLPAWILPAVQVAVRMAAWRNAPDPIAEITFAVRRIAIQMKLSGGNRLADVALTEDAEAER